VFSRINYVNTKSLDMRFLSHYDAGSLYPGRTP
jgi:hypothetical protein